MMDSTSQSFSPDEVRDDFIPKDVYFSPEFARLEAEHLWPYVWQLACRLEEIPNVGDYVTYDIVDESIIIVRTSKTTIKAHHNVCPHRGRRLTQGCGHAQHFVCRFHGWQFGLDGDNTRVIDRADWGDCLSPTDIRLKEVKVDTWGGFVFINMDPNSESLAEFLRPIDDYCAKFEFEKLRFRWYKTAVMPANWKTILEFFNEFYHVQQTHMQLLPFTNDYSNSDGFGRHAAMWYPATGALPLSRSPRLPPKDEPDFRNFVLEFVETFNRDLKAMVTERNFNAAQRLRKEVAATAEPVAVLQKWVEFQLEAAAEDGSGWPAELTPEYIENSKLDWHVFPNTIYLHGFVDGVLWYRARPNGHDPESCIFDVWSLQRYGDGQAPPLKREFYEDWRQGDWPMILQQDFANLGAVQQGMKSRGFAGSRTNPVQERAISNFHRRLREFLRDASNAKSPAA
jgi:phenylpropionate dioxygenase-like ring-hydroxylating dioxygenase large terminal subunit